jgi:quercetin dioxygenase-like cupin family protein
MSGLTQGKIQQLTQERWEKGNFLELRGTHQLPSPKHDHLPWLKHECMRAKLLRVTPGEIGELLLKFAPNGHEDLELHSHPVSDRIISVLGGNGVFQAIWNGEAIERQIKPGHVLYMPRGIFHTFLGNEDPLVVHAIHNPWVPMDDPNNIVYPDGTTSRTYEDWDGQESIDKWQVPEALTSNKLAVVGAASG